MKSEVIQKLGLITAGQMYGRVYVSRFELTSDVLFEREQFLGGHHLLAAQIGAIIAPEFLTAAFGMSLNAVREESITRVFL